jgi:predicted porin
MHPRLLRPLPMLAAVLGVATAAPAAAQSSADLRARCDQLISYYDRYGASRGENSDGARNHTRIGAAVDCQQGRYADGIASMETLLKQKHFDVPPPVTGIAQPPAK